MKKITLLFVVLVVACTKTPKNYAILQGNIQNATSESVFIQNRDYTKEVKIDANGNFRDTLQLSPTVKNYLESFYTLSTENGRLFVYLKNGYDLTLETDANNFEENLVITGKGAENSNYILNRIQASDTLDAIAPLFSSEKEDFFAKVEEIKEIFDALVYKHKNIDKALQEGELQNNQEL
jgi:hypothetical protein